jgi:hypothetical protein
MPTLKASILLGLDGHQLPGTPLVRREKVNDEPS